MILRDLTLMWEALAPALKNHLWQSTFFVFLAALLTLALRKNHARTRYWLWLAASVKFLLPLSLLVSIGSHLAGPRPTAAVQTGLYSAIEEVSQPFTQQAAPIAAGCVSAIESRIRASRTLASRAPPSKHSSTRLYG